MEYRFVKDNTIKKEKLGIYSRLCFLHTERFKRVKYVEEYGQIGKSITDEQTRIECITRLPIYEQ
jgi:hypothetical protein